MAALLLFGGGRLAAAQEIQVALPDSSGMEGNELVIPVRISDTGITEDIYSWQMKISYASNRLDALEIITDGTLIESEGMPASNLNTPGIVSVAYATDTPMPLNGILFFIRFKLLSPVFMSNLQFVAGECFFNEPGSVSATFGNGRITITAKPSFTITPASFTLFAGDSLKMSVPAHAGPVVWESENPSVATISPDGWVKGENDGTTEITATDTTGTTNANTAVITVRILRLSFKNQQVFQGNEATIPVYLENPSGVDIYSGEIECSWSPLRVTGYEIETEGTLLESANVQSNYHNQKFSLAFASGTPLALNEQPLFYIILETSRNHTGDSGFRLVESLFNDLFKAVHISGTVQLNALPVINIQPRKPTLVAGDTLVFIAGNTTGPVEWSVSNAAIAGVDNDGILIAESGGLLTVTAEDSIGAKGSTDEFVVYDTRASTPDTTFFSGESVKLPLRIGGLPDGKSILSFEMEGTYDANRLTLTGVSSDGTLTHGWMAAENNSPGTFRMAFAGTRPINEKGTLINFLFDVEDGLTNVTANFTISKLTLNEGDPTALLSTPNPAITHIPARPVLVSPAHFATGVPKEGKLIWNPVHGATNYTIQISKDQNFSPLLIEKANLTEASYSYELSFETIYYWRVMAHRNTLNSDWSLSRRFTTEVTTGAEEEKSTLPKRVRLYQNYPNPFNPATTIRFDIPEEANVRVDVFNAIGQRVAVLANRIYPPGSHEVSFNGDDYPSGLYIYRMSVEEKTKIRMMSLVK